MGSDRTGSSAATSTIGIAAGAAATCTSFPFALGATGSGAAPPQPTNKEVTRESETLVMVSNARTVESAASTTSARVTRGLSHPPADLR
jgi:hypothetical protein